MELPSSDGEECPSKETSASSHDEIIRKNKHNQPGVKYCDRSNQSSIHIEMTSDHGGSIVVQQKELQEQNSNTPLNWLILVADGLHNLIGVMFIGANFLDRTRSWTFHKKELGGIESIKCTWCHAGY